MTDNDNNANRDDREPVIEVRGLVKRFGCHTVLSGVNLDVYPGEMLVIMGGSGCGKSTLLRHLIGSYIADEGTVKLFGQNVAELDDAAYDEFKKRFGVLFQSGALFNSMTVGENVALPLKEHTDLDDATIDIMVKIKLEQVGLRQAEDLMPSEISGGMKKRAGLARAVSLDPEILFYDEPSAGLDPVTSAEIDFLMMDLARKLGVASVVVTHEMDSAFRIADRMIMLDKGNVLMDGPRSDFEALRDSGLTGAPAKDTVRQFLRGDSEGPITQRRQNSGFEDDILNAAAGID
ncbi:MAG: ATP-binding cassette domain-containing protein [Planctomycetes bacterium]|nr:ABC transporter ATP-binding protein [Phycisphaerae bacterium]NBB95504.1 ATP-binding cassette domain-containing protein [Planctomycetota bacterium]